MLLELIFCNYAKHNPLNLKRLIAIFFLILFLFNLGGYHLVFWEMQRQAKKDLLYRLDADNYAFGETIILTLPLSLPYNTNTEEFQRVDGGDFEYEGEHYVVVKQKFENDVLYLVCVKNNQSKKIEAAQTDYTKLANDLPAGTKQAQNFIGKLFKDYTSSLTFDKTRVNTLLDEFFFADMQPLLTIVDYSIDSPPPEGRS